MIYLDNSATTLPHQEIIEQFQELAQSFFANPSSIHQLGGKVERLQSAARAQAAKLLDIDQEEVVFTSGGTEGNNLAIKGVALAHQNRGKHIITSEIEHASVYETCKGLEKLGFEITYLPVDDKGMINLSDLKNAIRKDTILVSIMHVNNEIGTIQPIKAVGELLKNYPKAYFHVDAVQSLGKIPLSLKENHIDLCTFSGHKIHGLNGTGMLFVKKGMQVFPLFHGGGQEQKMRSGTENVAGNVTFVKAMRMIFENMTKDAEQLLEVKSLLYDKLQNLDLIELNTPLESAPHIIHFSVPGIKPETLIHALYEEGFVTSTQSACSSKVSEKSRVLEACGKKESIVNSGLRVSLNYNTKKADIEAFVKALEEITKEFKTILR